MLRAVRRSLLRSIRLHPRSGSGRATGPGAVVALAILITAIVAPDTFGGTLRKSIRFQSTRHAHAGCVVGQPAAVEEDQEDGLDTLVAWAVAPTPLAEAAPRDRFEWAAPPSQSAFLPQALTRAERGRAPPRIAA